MTNLTPNNFQLYVWTDEELETSMREHQKWIAEHSDSVHGPECARRKEKVGRIALELLSRNGV